jgi:23S rRNA (pseudouridine1915-N3)-methyltransferase
VARREATRRERTDWTAHLKLRVIWVGRTRDDGLAGIARDLVARIGRFVPIEVTELKDPKTGNDQRQLAAEAEKLLAALDSTDRVVVLDAVGEMWSSEQFSKFVGSHLRSDSRRLTFIIGGYGGLADAVKKRADKSWSLSRLTFTHEMTRVLVLEQLYRAMAILKNHPYSK